MKVSNMTDHIKALVEQGGGVFVTQYVSGALEIFPYKPTAKVKLEFAGDKGYSFKFVEDSVKAGKLLRLDDYEMKRIVNAKAASPTTRAKRTREEATAEPVADVEPTPKKRLKATLRTPEPVSTPLPAPSVAAILITTTPKATSKQPEEVKTEQKKSSPTRTFYTQSDEIRMQQYVASNPGSTKSLAYWKQALVSNLQVYHTAESLKFHWAKVISERLAKGLPATRQSPKTPKQASPTIRYQTSSFTPEEVKEVPEKFETPIRPIIRSASKQRSDSRSASSILGAYESSSKPKKVRISPTKQSSPPRTRFYGFSPALSASPSSTGNYSPSKGLASLANEPTKLSQRFQEISDLKITAKLDGTRQVKNLTELRVKCVQAGIPERFLGLVQRCRVASGVRVSEAEVLRVLELNRGKESETEAYFGQHR